MEHEAKHRRIGFGIVIVLALGVATAPSAAALPVGAGVGTADGLGGGEAMAVCDGLVATKCVAAGAVGASTSAKGEVEIPGFPDADVEVEAAVLGAAAAATAVALPVATMEVVAKITGVKNVQKEDVCTVTSLTQPGGCSVSVGKGIAEGCVEASAEAAAENAFPPQAIAADGEGFACVGVIQAIDIVGDASPIDLEDATPLSTGTAPPAGGLPGISEGVTRLPFDTETSLEAPAGDDEGDAVTMEVDQLPSDLRETLEDRLAAEALERFREATVAWPTDEDPVVEALHITMEEAIQQAFRDFDGTVTVRPAHGDDGNETADERTPAGRSPSSMASPQEGPPGEVSYPESPAFDTAAVCETETVPVGPRAHVGVCYTHRYVYVMAFTGSATIPDLEVFLGWYIGEIPAGEKKLCAGVRATSEPVRDIDVVRCYERDAGYDVTYPLGETIVQPTP